MPRLLITIVERSKLQYGIKLCYANMVDNPEVFTLGNCRFGIRRMEAKARSNSPYSRRIEATTYVTGDFALGSQWWNDSRIDFWTRSLGLGTISRNWR